MEKYLAICAKLIVTIILLLFYIRISGRSQLAPASAFDQIGNMVIGAIGGTTLLDPSVSILDLVLFMSLWVFILLLIRYLKFKSIGIKEFFDGKRIQLVENGEILTENFQLANITLIEVTTSLHNEEILGFSMLENLWFEPNGQFTYDKKGNDKLSQIIIEEGKLNEENLSLIGYDEDWLEAELAHENIDSVADVFCGEWINGKLWLYSYQK
ncbi:MAG: DUF421 domain-containing protein [Tissierellia bacterium]|nr:DUF421 domain-containing protein [Tissierellia bacterium]